MVGWLAVPPIASVESAPHTFPISKQRRNDSCARNAARNPASN